MPHTTESQVSRAALLEKAYKTGLDAATGPSLNHVIEEFQKAYHQDRELVHEFMRGVQEQSASHRQYQGILADHGRAKYNHDPKAKMSYFVTLDTPKGPKTVWGVDLERAMISSGTQIGEPVHLAFKGSKDVTVDTNILDRHGNVIGTEAITTPRNVWAVTKIDAAQLSTGQSLNSSQRSPLSSAPSRLKLGGGSGGGLLGASGLGGLKNLLSFGGNRVNAKVADYSQQRAELDLTDALRSAGNQIASLKEAGLAPLADGSVDDAAKADLITAFRADPQHEGQIVELAKHLDKLSDLAEVVMGKGVGKGLDGHAVSRKGIEPIKVFMTENESILKALHVNDRSLYERLEGVVQHLLKALTDLLERVGAMFKSGGAPSATALQP